MVFIKFPNGADWFYANWVFRQLAESVKTSFPDDAEVNAAMEQAQWYGGLVIAEQESQIQSRLMQCMLKVAREIERSPIPSANPNELHFRNEYLKVISELRRIIEQQVEPSSSGNG